MYLRQKDLLSGLDKRFIRELMNISEKKNYSPGDVVFHEGNHASRFFVLIRGKVKLNVGPTNQAVFTISHAGEAFGWSSLLGRNVYAASAECMETTRLLRIDRVKFNLVLEQDPVNGLALIRRLAPMLGNRLHDTYKMLAAREHGDKFETYGSGQLIDLPLQ